MGRGQGRTGRSGQDGTCFRVRKDREGELLEVMMRMSEFMRDTAVADRGDSQEPLSDTIKCNPRSSLAV